MYQAVVHYNYVNLVDQLVLIRGEEEMTEIRADIIDHMPKEGRAILSPGFEDENDLQQWLDEQPGVKLFRKRR